MSAVPGGVDPDRGPPLGIPLWHFLVALGFLLVGLAAGLVSLWGLGLGGLGGRLAHVHLLLVGWVGLTIVGAMTQFVPVWAGVALYSRRLSWLALALVAVGTAGLTTALAASAWSVAALAGTAIAVGLWTFVYNLGRTLPSSALDETERHFAVALAAIAILPLFGLLLAADHAGFGLGLPGVDLIALRGAHVTVAVFGMILATVAGAMAQLVPMFTQAPDHPGPAALGRLEEASLFVGLPLAAVGRLVGHAFLATAGTLLLALAVLALVGVVAWHLLTATAGWSPMLTRYAVAMVAFVGWAVLAIPVWLARPLSTSALLGGATAGHLFGLGIAFVLFGTLYHVVPFLVWVEQYSDDLGLRDVPLIDDLYDGRVAVADGVLLTAGSIALVGGRAGDLQALALAGGAAFLLGAVLFVGNLLSVVYLHREGATEADSATATAP